MRIVLRSRPPAIFGAVFVVALIVLLPLRLAAGWFALDDVGLTARQVRGSVWRGTLDEAAFGGVPLGDLRAGLSPFALLAGRARVSVAAIGAPEATHGAVTVSRHGIGIDDVTARLAAGTVFAPLPVSQLDLTGVRARFEDGRCVEAGGRVHAAMAGDIAGVDLGGGLGGDARCDAGALLLPLASPSGEPRVRLRLSGAGRYHAELSVAPPDAAGAQRLTLAGFRPTPQGYILSIEGAF